jgi:hypothetical protein
VLLMFRVILVKHNKPGVKGQRPSFLFTKEFITFSFHHG